MIKKKGTTPKTSEDQQHPNAALMQIETMHPLRNGACLDLQTCRKDGFFGEEKDNGKDGDTVAHAGVVRSALAAEMAREHWVYYPGLRKASTSSVGVSTRLFTETPSIRRLSKKCWHSTTTKAHSARALPAYVLAATADPSGFDAVDFWGSARWDFNKLSAGPGSLGGYSL